MTLKQILNKLNHRDTRLFPKSLTLTKITFILLAILTVTFTTKILLAQNTNTSNNLIRQKQDAIYEGNNQEAWIDSALGSNLMSLQIALSGTFPEALLNDDIKDNSYIPGGIIGISNQIIASTFTPMASGIEYIAQVKNNFLGKPAYAANQTGFEGLKSIMNLWKMFRNVVYIFISLIFVAIGIMIMLRIKISPQATITIQSSIPKIISTLILITFSYAIAGLCIDIINLFQAFAISLLFNGLGKNPSESLFTPNWSTPFRYIIENIQSALNLSPYDFSSLNNLDFNGVKSLINRLAPTSIIALLGGIIGGITGTFANPGLGTAIGFLTGSVGITLILNLIITIYLIKFIFSLAKCYISVLLKIIFAPFELLLGAFPNSKIGFSSWITGIFANITVFPISLIFLILANIIIDIIGGSSGLWAPSLVTDSGYSWFLPIIIGIASIALLSKLPVLIPEFIYQIKPSPFGKAIGEGLKSIPGVGLLGFGVNTMKSGIAEEAVGSGIKKFQNWRTKDNNTNADNIDFKNVPENKTNPAATGSKFSYVNNEATKKIKKPSTPIANKTN